MGVIPDHSSPGSFRIHYSVPVGAIGPVKEGRRSPSEHPPARGKILDLPVLRGGFIGEMIATPEPKLAMELDLKNDPHLGAAVGHLPSCMALPIFEGDTVLEWSLGFSHKREGFVPRDVAQAQLTANLLGVASRNLDAVEMIKSLNGRLHATNSINSLGFSNHCCRPAPRTYPGSKSPAAT